MNTNLGDAPIFRRMTTLTVADRWRISLWAAASCGTAKALLWRSDELKERVTAAQADAQQLRDAYRAIKNRMVAAGGFEPPTKG